MKSVIFPKTVAVCTVFLALMLPFFGVFCVNATRTIASLYAQLAEQRSLLARHTNYMADMDENRRLAEALDRPKVMALDEIAPAIVNLSAQMKAAGLEETYFKLERSEVRRETDGTSSVNRLMIEGVGAYGDVMRYLDCIGNGAPYYFIENLKITRENNGVRLRAVCVIVGRSDSAEADAPVIPDSYRYKNPFEMESS